MNSGHPNTGLGHIQGEGHLPHSTSQEEHTMLSAGASAGPSTAVGVGIFHGSLTQGESSSRMLGSNSGQFGSGSGRNNSSSLGYSPLYNLHGQSTPLASLPHYPVFFPQYPASHYSPASLVTSVHYPHIESYSAVLASMGSHVQHGAHTNPQTAVSNRTSSFLPTNVTQYTHCSLSSSSSPGPVSSSVRDHSPSGTASSYASHDCDSLLSQRRDEDTEISSPQRVPGSESHHDEKNLLHSVGLSYPCRGSSGAAINESLFGDPFYKVPCGKEGSLKHRILTRPHDIPLDANIVESKCLNKGVKVEEDLLGKRTQYIGGSATTMVASTSGSAGPENQVPAAPYALGAIPANSHAQRHPSPSGILSASPSAPPYSHLPTSTFPSSLSPSHSSPNLPPHLHYPPHFVKGSIIQLANGDLKRVEDLQTEDFVSSAQVSADLKVDSSTVVRIEEHPEVGTATLGFSVGEHRVQVTVEATLEHPFFVFGQGWSSCSTEHTLHRYGLDCHKLAVGDVCISLTHKDVSLKAADIVSQQQQGKRSKLTLPDTESDVQQEDAEREKAEENLAKCEEEDGSHPLAHQAEGNGPSCNIKRHGNQTEELSGSIVHAQSMELHACVSPTQISESSSHDVRPPRKRRWSAPESDVEKEKLDHENEKLDHEKENLDSSQEQ